MGDPLAYFEIVWKDPKGLDVFYRDLFGWTTRTEGGGYVSVDGAGLAGGLSGGVPHATFYVRVESPTQTLERAVAAGARVIEAVTSIAGGGEFATFEDPGGCRIGIFRGP